MRGRWDEAAAVLEELDAVRRPFRSLDYERSVARAWVAAGQGAVSEAIGILQSAAERAASTGDSRRKWCACRRRRSSAIVRASRGCGSSKGWSRDRGSAWRPLRRGDATRTMRLNWPRCQRLSRRWAIGVAAVDAAAQAALAYRRQDLRGSALGCAARAEALAEKVRSGYADAETGAGAVAADGSGARDRVVDRPGLVEPRRGGATDAVGSHRRRPHLQGDEQDRYHQPRRARPRCCLDGRINSDASSRSVSV